VLIRRFLPGDFLAVKAIYAAAVNDKFQTADLEMPDESRWRQWWELHADDQFPVWVAVADNCVVGWLSISPYRAGRRALSGTVELSYYVQKDHRRTGVGTALIQTAIKEARSLRYTKAIGIILSKNQYSRLFLEKAGFSLWGILPEVACIDGECCDHEYWGITL
jgi:phosphinothricin acetyltransferase